MELKARLSEGLTATSVSAWNDLIADFDLYNDTLEGTTKYYRDDAKAVALEEVLESHSVDVWARFGLAFAVGLLCRAMSRPTEQLYLDVQRVLLYLHRHREIGLRYEADKLPLRGQSDSDWGVRHSTTGWQFTYSSAVVSWGSKKQNSVALSSCEAEIMAASEAAKEGVFLSSFLSELGLPPTEPVEMGMDNQAAIAISYNPEFHSRTKHIDRRHFYVRECVENMQLRVPYVRTIDNLADFFTKPLPSKHFFRMRDALMNVPDNLACRLLHANEHLDRDGEAVDDSDVKPPRRKRGPRNTAAKRAGG